MHALTNFGGVQSATELHETNTPFPALQCPAEQPRKSHLAFCFLFVPSYVK